MPAPRAGDDDGLADEIIRRFWHSLGSFRNQHRVHGATTSGAQAVEAGIARQQNYADQATRLVNSVTTRLHVWSISVVQSAPRIVLNVAITVR